MSLFLTIIKWSLSLSSLLVAFLLVFCTISLSPLFSIALIGAIAFTIICNPWTGKRIGRAGRGWFAALICIASVIGGSAGLIKGITDYSSKSVKSEKEKAADQVALAVLSNSSQSLNLRDANTKEQISAEFDKTFEQVKFLSEKGVDRNYAMLHGHEGGKNSENIRDCHCCQWRSGKNS